MDADSELYLADHWVLMLHHLVWTKRLPGSINVRWVRNLRVLI